MQKLFKSILVLYISYISFVWTSNSASKVPLWTWECKNEKCIPLKASQTRETLQSLETCNMLCSGSQLWPSPTGPVAVGTTAVPTRSDFFQIEVEYVPSDVVRQHLRDVFQSFKQALRNLEGRHRSFGDAQNVIVRVSVNDSGDHNLRLNTDESYQLSVEPVSIATIIAEIRALSYCGARHALETLSQLVWMDSYLDTLLIIQEASIVDRPKFGYRGLMIDTARNHIPFSDLLRTVDTMAASKLNTLHWHASDSQAFSIQFDSVPELARYGANSPADFYTSDQVKALVHRARLHGIRVLIEIDAPAHMNHALNWGPENQVVQCVDSKPSTLYCDNPPCGQINPNSHSGLETLQNIYSDILQLTEVDDIFHLGGDDVSTTCWSDHHNESDPMVFWQQFIRSILQRIEYVNGKLPNITVFWPSSLSERIKSDFKDLSYLMGLQVRSATWTEKYITGLRKIVSHEDAWDLNTGYGSWHDSDGKTPFNSWQRFYEHRPWVKSGDGSIIIGGEATLWSWTVGEGGLDARVWARTAAMAERLWSDRPEGTTSNVYARFDIHRARLAKRGIRIAPLWSQWCTQNPFTCS